MALVDRLSGINIDPEGSDKLPVLTFVAALFELANGQVTKPQIVAFFALQPDDETDLDWLIAQYQARPDQASKDKFLNSLLYLFALAEREAPGYNTTAALAARIQAI